MRLPVAKAIALVGLAAWLAILVPGCGGSGSTTTGGREASGPSGTSSGGESSTTTTTPPGARHLTPSHKRAPSRHPGKGSGSGTSGKGHHPSIAEEEAQAGDHSIQEYGSEAQGSEKEAVVATMRSYFRALANHDYVKVCATLTSANRNALRQFSMLKHEGPKSCASLLARLLTRGSSEARKAASATVSRVRIGKGNAFILFRPAGGKVSYFVMKSEGGKWKATSISAGTQLSP